MKQLFLFSSLFLSTISINYLINMTINWLIVALNSSLFLFDLFSKFGMIVF